MINAEYRESLISGILEFQIKINYTSKKNGNEVNKIAGQYL